jgi:hypothetical protein
MKLTDQSATEIFQLSLKGFTDGKDMERILFIDGLFTGLKNHGRVILKNHEIPSELFKESDLPQLFLAYENIGKALLQALTFPLEVPHHYFDLMVDQGDSFLSYLTEKNKWSFLTIIPDFDLVNQQINLVVTTGSMLSRMTNDVMNSHFLDQEIQHSLKMSEQDEDHLGHLVFSMRPTPEAILSCIPKMTRKCQGGVGPAKYPDIEARELFSEC